MVDLTKKKTLGEYETGVLAGGDTVVTYRPTNAVGEKVFRGDIVAGTAASIADGTSTALKMYSDKALKDAVNNGAIPVGTDTEIETGTDTTAKLYAPDQLNSAIDSLIETAVPDGTKSQIITGTDTTERKFTPADINGAVKDIAVAQYAGRTAMKAAAGLTAGDVVYLSEGGRSGTFEYLVGDYSAEVAADTLEGVYVALDAVAATAGVLKRVLNGYVTPEMFGAEVGVDCRAAINAASAFRGRLRFMPRTYLISGTVYKYRGSFWSGAASVDTAEGRGTIIKKLGDVKMPMLQTERASGLGGGASTHYYDMEDIYFNGNLDDQTEEHDALQLWGMWIGSGVKNIFVGSHRGQAVTFAHGADVKVDRLWVQRIVCESGYAVNFNEPYDGTSTAGGIFYGGQIYIENISNKMGGDPRDVEADRGNAMRINRVTVCNINDLHIEGARRLVDVESAQAVNINKLSYAHVGLSTDTDSCALRHIDTGSYVVRVGVFAGATNINLINFAGLAAGLSSNLIMTHKIGSDPRGLEYCSTTAAGNRMTLAAAQFANSMAARRVGTAAAAYVRLENSDGSESAYIKQSGTDLFLGSTFNQSGEVDFLQIDSNGGSGDRVYINSPIVVNDERDIANNILSNSIWKSSALFGPGSGLAYQRVTGITSGADMICAYQRGTAAPTSDADYIGQGFIDTVNRNIYIAVDTGTGASDWVQTN